MSENYIARCLDEIAWTLENESDYRWIKSDKEFERILIKEDTNTAFLVTVTVRPIQ